MSAAYAVLVGALAASAGFVLWELIADYFDRFGRVSRYAGLFVTVTILLLTTLIVEIFL